MHMIGKDFTICEEGPFPSFTFFFVHFDYWSIKRKKQVVAMSYYL